MWKWLQGKLRRPWQEDEEEKKIVLLEGCIRDLDEYERRGIGTSVTVLTSTVLDALMFSGKKNGGPGSVSGYGRGLEVINLPSSKNFYFVFCGIQFR